ncbi:hypothetical protein Tco_0650419 [Tanacetum coccineum]
MWLLVKESKIATSLDDEKDVTESGLKSLKEPKRFLFCCVYWWYRTGSSTIGLTTEKFNKEKEKNEKLKEVKARLNFGGSTGSSRYSKSRMMSTKEYEKRYRSRRSRSPRPSPSVFSRLRRDRSRSPKPKEKEGGVFKRLGSRVRSVSARSDSHNQPSYSRYTYALSESEDSGGGHWKSRSKKKKLSREEEDLSQP